ncbi:MAG: DUF424 family protein [Nanoarchaeota archaeon]|nr:DUF424 family protein [Nanoarchaeota archaeon]
MNPAISAKRHIRDGKLLLVVCDTALLGKKILDEDKQLDLSAVYYQGTAILEGDLVRTCGEAYIIDCVGPKAIKMLVAHRIIDEKDVLKIGDTPYSLLYRG